MQIYLTLFRFTLPGANMGKDSGKLSFLRKGIIIQFTRWSLMQLIFSYGLYLTREVLKSKENEYKFCFHLDNQAANNKNFYEMLVINGYHSISPTFFSDHINRQNNSSKVDAKVCKKLTK